MHRGSNRGRGSDIHRRIMVNMDQGAWMFLEQFKDTYRALSYSDAIRQVIVAHASCLMGEGTAITNTTNDPDEIAEMEEAAKKLKEVSLIGKVFHFPTDYEPGVYVTVCPLCNGNDFYEDVLTWNCNDCMWAGQVDYVKGNTTIIVTHKMKRKYPRDAA